MRTSNFISVHSRQITLFACFFSDTLSIPMQLSDLMIWSTDPAAVLAQLAQQGDIRAAEHRLWKDTRKSQVPQVAMLLG